MLDFPVFSMSFMFMCKADIPVLIVVCKADLVVYVYYYL